MRELLGGVTENIAHKVRSYKEAPFFDNASKQPNRIANGTSAPSSGNSNTGSRITIGTSWVALA